MFEDTQRSAFDAPDGPAALACGGVAGGSGLFRCAFPDDGIGQVILLWSASNVVEVAVERTRSELTGSSTR